MNDLISRQAAIDAICKACSMGDDYVKCVERRPESTFCDEIVALRKVSPAQQEEVIPHRNYKYLSDYWCECGWHLGKKGEVKYCPECGRKVNWDG